MPMTKKELKDIIKSGVLPREYEPQNIGQGYGYKIDFDVWDREDDNVVVYIPEFGYDEDGMPISIYSFNDFLNICNGNRALAYQLLEDVDWQHPETLYDEWMNEDF